MASYINSSRCMICGDERSQTCSNCGYPHLNATATGAMGVEGMPTPSGIERMMSDFSGGFGINPFFRSSAKKPKSKMSRLSTFAKKALDKDTRDLVKAGVLDSELDIEDTNFILSHYVMTNKKALAEEARKLIKEREDR